MTDINSQIPAGSGITQKVLDAPIDINDRGQIVSSSLDSTGNSHALLLTPASPCFTVTTADVREA